MNITKQYGHAAYIAEIESTRTPAQRRQISAMGMWLFLLSLAVLFTSTLIGYVVVALQIAEERDIIGSKGGSAEILKVQPVEMPPLPWLLYVSTFAILLVSATAQYAKISAKNNNLAGLKTGLNLTLYLSIIFMALQAVCWYLWYNSAVLTLESDFSRFAALGFLVMSGLHAAHVIGGIIPTVTVITRAKAGRYTAENHSGVTHLTSYWHFLDGVWIVLFVFLLIFT